MADEKNNRTANKKQTSSPRLPFARLVDEASFVWSLSRSVWAAHLTNTTTITLDSLSHRNTQAHTLLLLLKIERQAAKLTNTNKTPFLCRVVIVRPFFTTHTLTNTCKTNKQKIHLILIVIFIHKRRKQNKAIINNKVDNSIIKNKQITIMRNKRKQTLSERDEEKQPIKSKQQKQNNQQVFV